LDPIFEDIVSSCNKLDLTLDVSCRDIVDQMQSNLKAIDK